MESKADSTRPKIDSGDPDNSAEEARAFAARLVAERVANGEQRMAAYAAVGRLAEHCESWVRRLMRGDVKRIGARAYLGLKAADDAREARQMARAAALLESAARRRGRAHDWLAGTAGAGAGVDGGPPERGHGDAGAVDRPLAGPGGRP